MNDFTKDELVDIYDALMNTEIPIFENLPSKVQSIIDNYCEHEIETNTDGKNWCKHCWVSLP